jgi:hypothetical protein
VAKTQREREQEARQAKLENVREQIASGQLVIRAMSPVERSKWAKRQAQVEAHSTPAVRASRAAANENRRKRAARLS